MRLYLLVRRDLSKPQQAVQAAHAVAQLVFRHRHRWTDGTWGAHGPHFVLLGVRDEKSLHGWFDRLDDCKEAFFEPDLSGAMTAIAYYGPEVEGFEDLRLL